MITLRNPDQCPTEYKKSAGFVILDCDCHDIAGGGERSGISQGKYPAYKITWPQHPEYHNHYIAITKNGIAIL
jgi:hypothetical protein